MTQEQLASHLFVDRSLISRWESGKSTPSEEQQKILFEVLSIPAEVTEKTPANNEHYITGSELLCILLSLLGFFLNPLGILFSGAALFLSVRRNMPLYIRAFCLIFVFITIDELLFMYGISLPKLTL